MLLQAGARIKRGSSISGCVASYINYYHPSFASLSSPQNQFEFKFHSLPRAVDERINSSINYAAILRSCIARRAISPGKQIHAHMLTTGRGYNIDLVTKLVNLYCVCGYLSDAHHLFDRNPKQNIFLWNVLIRGYAWNGPYEVAISLYYQMIDYGLVPDNFTFPFVLKACSGLSNAEVGRDVHEYVVRTGCENDVYVGAALIDMYAKCSCTNDARRVFDSIRVRDVVLWNSMLAAYSQNSCPEECLSLCGEMMASFGMRPTVATLVTAISASADSSAITQGRELHGFSWRQGFHFQDKVKTALVDMYAKSGSVRIARVLFDKLVEKRTVSWNAMITGYAMHGHSKEALDLYRQMTAEASPDHVTFVGVFQACNRGGFLELGRNLFELMTRDYHIEPTVQHYTCMVDLFGHCGEFDEAYGLIKKMKVEPDAGVWGALLNACKIHGNVELGEVALERLVELEPDDAGNYVILSNLYAQKGRWEGVAKLRKLMNDRGLKKSVARSWIEVKNLVHTFLSGDVSHFLSDEIYAELDRLKGLMAAAGYIPNTSQVFHDVEDDEKTRLVWNHSERLAIAFGLISTPSGSRLLITKNLRVCEDCHVAIKFISRIEGREITVRDVNRYHHFKDGTCSCGDYW